MVHWYTLISVMVLEAMALIPIVWTIGHETRCQNCPYSIDDELDERNDDTLL